MKMYSKMLLCGAVIVSGFVGVHAAQNTFNDYIKNDAKKLKALVQTEEFTGRHCPELFEAVCVLREQSQLLFGDYTWIWDVERKKYIEGSSHHYIGQITVRYNVCNQLIDALWNFRAEDVKEICVENKHITDVSFFANTSGEMTYPQQFKDKNGCDVTTTMFPLHYAFLCFNKAQTYNAQCLAHDNIVTLLNCCANPNSYDHNDETPLYKACTVWQIVLLLRRGARINIQNKQGRTPLMVHIAKGRYDLAECLIQAGVCADEQDNDGNTALHLLAEAGHMPTLVYLVRVMRSNSSGAIAVRNNKGKTPLDIAHDKQFEKIVTFMEQHKPKLIKW